MASLSVGVACVLLVLCMVVPSLAAVYTVGDTSGWTTGIDYSTWTQGKTFKVGDTLVFKYPTFHTVDEVSSSDYSTCTVGNAIRSDNSGSTTVTLKAAGTHYFICGVVGHSQQQEQQRQQTQIFHILHRIVPHLRLIS
uniref:Phytocyanin domain-containing protein n=1 Tax=Gossypium raimondii TaxID=29730 RepID=A0A0D2S9G3_GOSRA|nr:hypothetical protein B456_009G280000 [Gossypium raimondii]